MVGARKRVKFRLQNLPHGGRAQKRSKNWSFRCSTSVITSTVNGKCYPQKCVFLRIRAYPQKCLRQSDFWQKKAKLSRFFGEMPDQSCLYW